MGDGRGAPVKIHGYALRVIRQRSMLRTSDLARRARCDRSYINKIELGDVRQVSPEFYSRLLAALDLPERRVLMADPHDGGRVFDGAAT